MVFSYICEALSSSRKVTDISSFHYDLFLTGSTGLITLSKVFQLSWDFTDWFELFSKQNKILEVFTIITTILNVLLLIDFLVNFKERSYGQVPIAHALAILVFLNSLAMSITFVVIYSQQDQKIGVEMSFLNVAAGYIVPVISFTFTFVYSLYSYTHKSDYEYQVAVLKNEEDRNDALNEELSDINKRGRSCLVM